MVAGLSGAVSTQHPGQGVSELRAESAVDEEVDGTVDAGRCVLDGDDGVEEVAATRPHTTIIIIIIIIIMKIYFFFSFLSFCVPP